MAATQLATAPGTTTSTRTAAVVAGVGYVAIFFLAIFANFMAREGLIEPGDAAATATNIRDSEALFRAGTVAFLAVFVIDIAVAWGLWIVFRSANRDVSLLSAWSRLMYTVFLGVAVVFFYMVLELVSDADSFEGFGAGQLDAQVMLLLDAFNFTWLVGLVAFGLHLILVGYLILKSRLAPKLLGYILILAGTAYIVDTLAVGLIANYQDYADAFLAMVAVPSILGEMWLGLWLLLRAGRDEREVT